MLNTGSLKKMENKINLILLGVLSIGFLGFFALHTHWVGLIFAHIAALAIMGFFGSWAAYIAKNKGYHYWSAFRVGFFPPLILGILAAFLFVPDDRSHLPITCGGWVSLAAGLVIVLIFVFLRKKR
jgi:hypothetical protein